MKNFYYLFMILVFTITTFAQTSKIPYPIIFIHGITSDYRIWTDETDGRQPIKNYLESIGLLYGGNIDITLDFLRSEDNLMNTISEDVHKFTELNDITDNDFYTLNFAVHSSGYSTKYDNNYPYARNSLRDPGMDITWNYVLLSISPRNGEYVVGDIIRIGSELMLIVEVQNDRLIVNRGILGTTISTHYFSDFVFNLSNESNQASIAKQGYGLYLAINLIKQKTSADKVIIVGHSMGGLCAREYMESKLYPMYWTEY